MFGTYLASALELRRFRNRKAILISTEEHSSTLTGESLAAGKRGAFRTDLVRSNCAESEIARLRKELVAKYAVK